MTVAPTQDVGDLVPWAEPNSIVHNDMPMELACLQAMSNPVPNELADAQLYKHPDPDLPVVHLMAFLTHYAPTGAPRCDRCLTEDLCTDRLLVPMHMTVVAVHVCTRCRTHLGRAFPGLCWE